MKKILSIIVFLCLCEFSLFSQTESRDDPRLPKVLWPEDIIKLQEAQKQAQDISLLAAMVDAVEEVQQKTTAVEALSYVAEAFAEHGYNETGNWGGNLKKISWVNYYPVEGSLPAYLEEDFQLPVEGKLTSYYGYRPRYGRFHHGIDVRVNPGDTVCCSLPGVVSVTGYEPGGYGQYVVVTHSGGVETLYAHLQTRLVRAGQKMEAGDAVGLGGATGNATGPHLHFETRYRGVALDPISWFNLSGKF